MKLSLSSTQRSALSASTSSISRLRSSLSQYAAPVGPGPSAGTSNLPPLSAGRLPTAPSIGPSSTSTGRGEPASPATAEQVQAQLDAQVQDAASPSGVPQAPQVEAEDPMLALTDSTPTVGQQASGQSASIPWARIAIGAGMVIGVVMLLRRRRR